jgi:hypothetical protein
VVIWYLLDLFTSVTLVYWTWVQFVSPSSSLIVLNFTLMACPYQLRYAHMDKLGSKSNWIGLDTIYGIYVAIIFERSILNQYKKHNYRNVFVGYILFQIVHVGGCVKFLIFLRVAQIPCRLHFF